MSDGTCGPRPSISLIPLLDGTVLDETEPIWRSPVAGEFELLPLVLFSLLQPPPMGRFLKAPPLVQYLLQVLQKWRG